MLGDTGQVNVAGVNEKFRVIMGTAVNLMVLSRTS
jgi:hypothetical protein